MCINTAVAMAVRRNSSVDKARYACVDEDARYSFFSMDMAICTSSSSDRSNDDGRLSRRIPYTAYVMSALSAGDTTSSLNNFSIFLFVARDGAVSILDDSSFSSMEILLSEQGVTLMSVENVVPAAGGLLVLSAEELC